MSERLPPTLAARDAEGRLLLAGRTVGAWADEAGDTPFFLYSAAAIDARVAELRSALPPGVALSYALKANPHPAVVWHLARLVDAVDVASAGELAIARSAGVAPGAISFAGPAKRDRELAAALEAGVLVHVESAGELRRLTALARAAGRRARVALRVNPPFSVRGAGLRMGGGASPFGIDAADVPGVLAAVDASAVAFEGFHFFTGSQILDAEALAQALAAVVRLAASLAARAPAPVVHLNLGGGLGVPYFPADRPLDLALLGRRLSTVLADLAPALARARPTLELGRYLVAEAGAYVARVVDVKRSAGERFVLTDGGLHHQLAASGQFGQVVRRNYPVALAHAPPPEGAEPAHVVGCLCTPLDRLAHALPLPEAGPGDLVVVFMAGAYGRTASPERFLAHPPPREIFAPA